MAVRPARLGLLVPTTVDGITWMRIFEAALAAHSRVLGAAGNLICPLTADLMEQELFWALADRFDADAFVSYAPTRAEMEEFAPDQYASIMGSLRQKVGELNASKEAADDFLERAEREIAFDVRPTAEQLRLLNARLAPFQHEENDPGLLDRFNALDGAVWPFTDAVEFVQRPGAVRNPTAPSGAARQLLLTATVGRLPASLAAVLRDSGMNVIDERLADGYDWADV